MDPIEATVIRTRRKIGFFLALRVSLIVLSGWLLVWGTAVLILRGIFGFSREPMYWGIAGVVAAIVVGIVSGIRRSPSLTTVRAMLDHHWRRGGLMMASAETNSEGWAVSAPQREAPRIHWAAGRQLGILACSAAFLLASFLVPARLLGEFQNHRLQVGQEAQNLAEKIALLKEEKILPPERAESLEQTLERLQQEAQGRDPGKTWEALDHLEQSISKASQEAAEKSAKDAAKSAAAEELASALNQAASQMNPASLKEAMSSLSADVRQALEENAMLAESLPEDLLAGLDAGDLSPEELSKLAKSLGECKSGQLSKLGKLSAAKLISASQLKRAQGECKIDPDGLAKLLSECQGAGELRLCLAQCQKPGKGGVSRGRGDAEMTWTDEASRENVTFKEQVLPPGRAATLKDAELQGVSVGAPVVADGAASAGGGGLDLSTAGRGSARTQVILPEHKKAVQRFFSRMDQTGKTEGAGKPAPGSESN